MSHPGFIRSHQNKLSALYRLLDAFFIFLAYWFASLFLSQPLTADGLLPVLLANLLFLFFAESMELYRSWRSAAFRDMWGTMVAVWFLAQGAMLGIAFFAPDWLGVDAHLLGYWFFFGILTLSLWRYAYRRFLVRIRVRGYNSRSAAIVGVTESGRRLARSIVANPQYGIRLLGFYDDREVDRLGDLCGQPMLGSVDDAILQARENQVDTLYIAMPLRAEKRISDILRRCGDSTVAVHIIPDFFVYNLLHARWSEVGGVQTLSVYDTPLDGLASWTKRMEDIVLASLILLLIALPMLAIAIGIKLSSPGPVFFKQDRYGLDGRKIKVWKFRSMRTMENGTKVTQAQRDDPRVTRFGSFLRRTSLDELPQFFNVLTGSMSVVGPRPHAVAHNEQYRALIECYMLRHKVKPGITGWAQINGWRGETDTLDKMQKRVEYDLAYIRNWSLWLDLKIVYYTIFKGFVGSNVY